MQPDCLEGRASQLSSICNELRSTTDQRAQELHSIADLLEGIKQLQEQHADSHAAWQDTELAATGHELAANAQLGKLQQKLLLQCSPIQPMFMQPEGQHFGTQAAVVQLSSPADAHGIPDNSNTQPIAASKAPAQVAAAAAEPAHMVGWPQAALLQLLEATSTSSKKGDALCDEGPSSCSSTPDSSTPARLLQQQQELGLCNNLPHRAMSRFSFPAAVAGTVQQYATPLKIPQPVSASEGVHAWLGGIPDSGSSAGSSAHGSFVGSMHNAQRHTAAAAAQGELCPGAPASLSDSAIRGHNAVQSSNDACSPPSETIAIKAAMAWAADTPTTSMPRVLTPRSSMSSEAAALMLALRAAADQRRVAQEVLQARSSMASNALTPFTMGVLANPGVCMQIAPPKILHDRTNSQAAAILQHGPAQHSGTVMPSVKGAVEAAKMSAADTSNSKDGKVRAGNGSKQQQASNSRTDTSCASSEPQQFAATLSRSSSVRNLQQAAAEQLLQDAAASSSFSSLAALVPSNEVQNHAESSESVERAEQPGSGNLSAFHSTAANAPGTATVSAYGILQYASHMGNCVQDQMLAGLHMWGSSVPTPAEGASRADSPDQHQLYDLCKQQQQQRQEPRQQPTGPGHLQSDAQQHHQHHQHHQQQHQQCKLQHQQQQQQQAVHRYQDLQDRQGSWSRTLTSSSRYLHLQSSPTVSRCASELEYDALSVELEELGQQVEGGREHLEELQRQKQLLEQELGLSKGLGALQDTQQRKQQWLDQEQQQQQQGQPDQPVQQQVQCCTCKQPFMQAIHIQQHQQQQRLRRSRSCSDMPTAICGGGLQACLQDETATQAAAGHAAAANAAIAADATAAQAGVPKLASAGTLKDTAAQNLTAVTMAAAKTAAYTDADTRTPDHPESPPAMCDTGCQALLLHTADLAAVSPPAPCRACPVMQQQLQELQQALDKAREQHRESSLAAEACRQQAVSCETQLALARQKLRITVAAGAKALAMSGWEDLIDETAADLEALEAHVAAAAERLINLQASAAAAAQESTRSQKEAGQQLSNAASAAIRVEELQQQAEGLIAAISSNSHCKAAVEQQLQQLQEQVEHQRDRAVAASKELDSLQEQAQQLQQQMTTVQQQLADADKAKQQLAADVALKEHQVQVARGDCAAAQDKLSQVQTSLAEARHQLEHLQVQGAQQQRQLDEGRQQLSAMQAQHAATAAEAAGVQQDLERVLRELTQAQQDVQASELQQAELEEANATQQRQQQEHHQAAAAAAMQRRDLEAQVAAAQEQLGRLQQQMQAARDEADLCTRAAAAADRHLMHVQQQLAAVQTGAMPGSAAAGSTAIATQHMAECAQLQVKLAAAESRRQLAEERAEECEKKLQQLKREVAGAGEKFETAARQLKQATSRVEELKEQLHEKTGQLNAMQQQLQSARTALQQAQMYQQQAPGAMQEGTTATQLQQQLLIYQQQMQAVEAKATVSHAQHQQCEQQLEQQRQLATSLQQQLSNTQQQLVQAQQQLLDCRPQRASGNAQQQQQADQLQLAVRSSIHGLQELLQAQSQLQHAQMQAEAAKQQVHELQIERKQLQKKLAAYKQQLAETRATFEKQQGQELLQLHDKKQELAGDPAAPAGATAKLAVATGQLQLQQQQLEACQQQLQALQLELAEVRKSGVSSKQQLEWQTREAQHLQQLLQQQQQISEQLKSEVQRLQATHNSAASAAGSHHNSLSATQQEQFLAAQTSNHSTARSSDVLMLDASSQTAERQGPYAALTSLALQHESTKQQLQHAHADCKVVKQEVQLLQQQLNSAKQQQQQQMAKSTELQQQLADSRAEVAQVKRQLSSSEAGIAGLKQQIADSQAGFAAVQQQLVSAEADAAHAKDQLCLLQHHHQQQQAEQEEQQQQKIQQMSKDLAQAKAALASICRSLQQLHEAAAALEEQLQAAAKPEERNVAAARAADYAEVDSNTKAQGDAVSRPAGMPDVIQMVGLSSTSTPEGQFVDVLQCLKRCLPLVAWLSASLHAAQPGQQQHLQQQKVDGSQQMQQLVAAYEDCEARRQALDLKHLRLQQECQLLWLALQEQQQQQQQQQDQHASQGPSPGHKSITAVTSIMDQLHAAAAAGTALAGTGSCAGITNISTNSSSVRLSLASKAPATPHRSLEGIPATHGLPAPSKCLSPVAHHLHNHGSSEGTTGAYHTASMQVVMQQNQEMALLRQRLVRLSLDALMHLQLSSCHGHQPASAADGMPMPIQDEYGQQQHQQQQRQSPCHHYASDIASTTVKSAQQGLSVPGTAWRWLQQQSMSHDRLMQHMRDMWVQAAALAQQCVLLQDAAPGAVTGSNAQPTSKVSVGVQCVLYQHQHSQQVEQQQLDHAEPQPTGCSSSSNSSSDGMQAQVNPLQSPQGASNDKHQHQQTEMQPAPFAAAGDGTASLASLVALAQQLQALINGLVSSNKQLLESAKQLCKDFRSAGRAVRVRALALKSELQRCGLSTQAISSTDAGSDQSKWQQQQQAILGKPSKTDGSSSVTSETGLSATVAASVIQHWNDVEMLLGQLHQACEALFARDLGAAHQLDAHQHQQQQRSGTVPGQNGKNSSRASHMKIGKQALRACQQLLDGLINSQQVLAAHNRPQSADRGCTGSGSSGSQTTVLSAAGKVQQHQQHSIGCCAANGISNRQAYQEQASAKQAKQGVRHKCKGHQQHVQAALQAALVLQPAGGSQPITSSSSTCSSEGLGTLLALVRSRLAADANMQPPAAQPGHTMAASAVARPANSSSGNSNKMGSRSIDSQKQSHEGDCDMSSQTLSDSQDSRLKQQFELPQQQQIITVGSLQQDASSAGVRRAERAALMAKLRLLKQ